MISFSNERDLLLPIARYAYRKTFRFQDAEVGFYEHAIDFYGYSPSLGLTVAVELKLRRWKRAFEQAMLYQLCSDLVFIAMPVHSIGPVDLQRLTDHGIGLISVENGGRCRRILSAHCSSVLRPHYRSQHIELLQAGALWLR
jgi:hypothetical protein